MEWMMKMLCATLGGWLGWRFGGLFGLTASLMISMIGSGLGWYVGARINREYR
jgi:hypothetical protein